MSPGDISALLIGLREGVEMTLIVGIVLAYLAQIGARPLQTVAWLGVVAAAGVSLGTLGLLVLLDREFAGPPAAVFEGTAMLLAALFLTWMIFWMLRQSRYLKGELQRGVKEALAQRGAALGVFALVFFAVVREGVETALLLFAAPGSGKLLGATLGLAIAAGIGVAIYHFGKRIDLRSFFRVTGIVLILFAAGLVTHGAQEFVEAGLVAGGPTVWALGGVLPDDSGIGAVLRSLLGYSADLTLLGAVAYVAYFVAIALLAQTGLVRGALHPKETATPTA